jgi:hypothetical protein
MKCIKKVFPLFILLVLFLTCSSMLHAKENTDVPKAEKRLLCNLPPADLGGDEGWELAKDKKGIKVYLRKTSLSPIRIFRGVATFDADFGQMVALIWDGERYVEWLLLCDEAKLLEVVSDTEQYLYTVNKPMVIRKRDSACHRQIFQDPKTLAVTVEMCNAEGYIPEKKGYIRLPVMYGYGKITPISKHKTELVYEVLVDVGGMVPKWIVNYYQGNIAYITFRNLIKKMMPLTAYEGVKYDFIKYPDFENKTTTADAQKKYLHRLCR